MIFFLSWGGNPSKIGKQLIDPMSQPIYPLPDHQLFQNEITNPTTSIKNMLYDFDIRRHMLTKTAEKELKKSQLMTNLCSQMETNLQRTHRYPSKKHHQRKQPRKKKKRRHYSSSSTQSSTTTDNSSTDSSN